MKLHQIRFKDAAGFHKELTAIRDAYPEVPQSRIIFHITWADESTLPDIVIEGIENVFPEAIYYGNEAFGCIKGGDLSYDCIVTCSVFEQEDTAAELVWVAKDTATSSLQDLWDLCRTRAGLRAVELIPTMSYLESLRIDGDVPDIPGDIHIFGGASVNYYDPSLDSAIIGKGHPMTYNGLAAVLYSGSGLNFLSTYVLGWKGLGNLMQVTECEGKLIKKINGKPAYSVYEKYLNLSAEDNDTLVFPLIVKEDNVEYIRTPQRILPDKSMVMIVNISKGSMVRIAYGDKNTILESLHEKAKDLAGFRPEGIKAYSCAARKMFWGDDEIGKETAILQEVAPVCGFYSGGEILKFGNRLKVLNQTLAIVAMFESSSAIAGGPVILKKKTSDKSVVSRLAYFIEKVSEEQELAREQLKVNMGIISGLATEYHAMYYYNLEKDFFRICSIDRQKFPEAGSMVVEGNDPLDTFRRFGASGLVHPDDKWKFAELNANSIKEQLAHRKKLVIRFRRKFGDEFLWTEMEAIKYEGIDEPANEIVLGFAERDSEIRREMELAQQQDLADQQRHIKIFGDMINAALWSIDINSEDGIDSIHWSDEFRHMFGFKDQKDFPDTLDSWSSRLHPEDRQRALDDFWSGIKDKSEGFVYDISYRIRRKNGRYCWYHAVGRQETRKNGKRRMFGIIMDMSMQKKLEDALSEAQSANRSKTIFLNNMSHDIRTPMNAIIGYTGLAASHIDNKEQVMDYLDKIDQSSEHLLALINDVLDMSRIESGKMHLEEKEESLASLIHSLNDIVQANMQAKGLNFTIDVFNVRDEEIVCDKLRLNQALLNVLSNSIKYTPSGGSVILTVSEKDLNANGEAEFLFAVKDTGIGMDKEFLKTIFEPFTRAKSSTVSGIQGTGLGMAITKNIVDMMDGRIEVDSAPGIGTEVTITLLLKVRRSANSLNPLPELANARALVIDDNPATCRSISRMMESSGLRLEWCTSGADAVRLAEEAARSGDAYKVIFIDWHLFCLSDQSTVDGIRRATGRRTQIIALASDAQDSCMAKDSVNAFISKPVFASDIRNALEKCGGSPSAVNAAEDQFSLQGRKVLLVEDNLLNREIATAILEEFGGKVCQAEDGDVAVGIMKSAAPGDFDLILMDIQMPVMNGYEATRRIRALGTEISKIPIIAMTANAFAEDRRAAFEAGMNEHISKPIDIEKFKEVLSRFM